MPHVRHSFRLTYTFDGQRVLNGFGNADFGAFDTSGIGPLMATGLAALGWRHVVVARSDLRCCLRMPCGSGGIPS